MRIKSNFKIDNYEVWYEAKQGNNSKTDADTVDNFHASQTPTPNTLLPLDENANFPSSVIPEDIVITDADTLDGKHADEISDTSLSNVSNITVKEKIRQVDGVGSGLDADKLDGYHANELISAVSIIDNAESIGGKTIDDFVIKPKITQLSKCGVNVQAFVIDGMLFMACGDDGYYDPQTCVTGLEYDKIPTYGVYHMYNVMFPSDSPVKKIAGFTQSYGAVLLENGELYIMRPGYSFTLVDTDVIDIFDHPSQGEYDAKYGNLFILKSDGLYGWGFNQRGQLGTGNTAPYLNYPYKCKFLYGSNTSSDYIKAVYPISSNYGFTYLLTSDGKIWFTGFNCYINTNNYNASGDGTKTEYYTSFKDVTQYWAELGDGTTTNSTTPVSPLNIPTDGSIVDIAGFGGGLTLTVQALSSNGDLWAWGYNTYGKVGDGTTEYRSTPIIVETGVTKLFSDGGIVTDSMYISSYIQKEDGLYACGYNNYLGVGYMYPSNQIITTYTKVLLPENDNQVVDLGFFVTNQFYYPTYAVYTTKGNLYVWGYNGNHGITMASTNDASAPLRVPLVPKVY